MPESERHAVALELGEFVRRVPARDGQMLIRRPQVLADCENVDAGRAEIAQRREQLVPFLAQAADDPGLRQQLGIHVLGAVEELQGPRVAATRPRDAVQPGNRFEVVIEDVWSSVDDNAERCGTAFEVGDQDFDRCLRQAAPDLADGRREHLGTPVRQVVAIHAGNDDMLEAHLHDCVGQALRFAGVERCGRPVGDRAVRAVPRTHVAQNHERGGFVLPALPDVGAVRLFTDRMQFEVAHHVLQRDVVGAAWRLHFQPRGFTGWLCLRCGGRLDLHQGGGGGHGRRR